MMKMLKPPAHKPQVVEERIDPDYRKLRMQVFLGIFIGYAGYYLVRKNFSMAIPDLIEQGYSKSELGVALSEFLILMALIQQHIMKNMKRS
jgi:OPA family glycerol-3-phosphate transporter-like MFS transporter